MIKLTRVYPRYYGGRETETLYVDEKSIVSVGKKRVECSGFTGYYTGSNTTSISYSAKTSPHKSSNPI